VAELVRMLSAELLVAASVLVAAPTQHSLESFEVVNNLLPPEL
jgi:hypothetical protein